MSNKKQQKRKGRPAFQLMILFLVITSLFVAVIGIILQKPQEVRKISDFNNIPNISLEFDEANRVEFNLASDVNNLRAESKLNVFSLEIEKSDLFSETTIEMTPLDEIVNLPQGLNFVAGINISPERLLLADISELTISISPEKDYPNLFGFVFDKENDELTLFPILEINGLVKMKISHLSAYGLVEGDPELLKELEILDSRKRFEDKLGRLDAVIRFKESFTGAYSEMDMGNAEQILVDWYNESLSLQVDEYRQNEDLINKYNEFLEWKEFIKSFNLETEFVDQINEFSSLVVTSLLKKSNLLYSECSIQHDFLKVDLMSRFINIIKKVDPKANTEFVQNLIKSCLTFDIEFESEISSQRDGEIHRVKLNAIVKELIADDNLKLSGKAEITISEYTIIGEKELNCTVDNYKSQLQINNSALNVVDLDVLLEIRLIDDLKELLIECDSEDSKTSISRTEQNSWITDFINLHASELKEGIMDNTFEISNFENVSEDNLVLRKVYNKEESNLTELTSIKIFHKPK